MQVAVDQIVKLAHPQEQELVEQVEFITPVPHLNQVQHLAHQEHQDLVEVMVIVEMEHNQIRQLQEAPIQAVAVVE